MGLLDAGGRRPPSPRPDHHSWPVHCRQWLSFRLVPCLGRVFRATAAKAPVYIFLQRQDMQKNRQATSQLCRPARPFCLQGFCSASFLDTVGWARRKTRSYNARPRGSHKGSNSLVLLGVGGWVGCEPRGLRQGLGWRGVGYGG